MSKKIEQLWVYVSVDPETGEEALLARESKHGVMPIFATSKESADTQLDYAARVADDLGYQVARLRFSERNLEMVVGGKSENEVH